LHTSTRLPSEDSFCLREWAVAACVRRPVRWVADLYCRERSRNPFASGTLFRGCRVRKMPTDIEFSRPLLFSGADGWGSLTDGNGPWLNLHTSTRLPSEDSLCLREWAVAACVRQPVRWVFPSMRGLLTTTDDLWTVPFRISHGVYR